MDLSQGLLLKNLILIGHRKDYRVKFNPGINIIYGDADTGKSSILRLVYYLLGGKQIKIDEEISSSVKYAVLEITANGKPYCISRDIFNPDRDIDVYSCKYSEISNSFPEKYKSSIAKGDDNNKSLSEFILEALELPVVRLKQAPTKDSSQTARLSFLDLFKFIYLDQDDVGSAHMLNIGNHVLETKNREVFKYIFNVLDSGISEIEVDIARKTQEKAQIANQYSAVSHFLSQTGFKCAEDLDEEISNIDNIKIEVKDQLSDLNKRMTSDNELYEGLKDALNTINLNIEQQEEAKSNAIRNIERFSRLLNDYQNDIDRIESSLSAKEFIGGDFQEKTNCPVCETIIDVGEISEKFDIPSDTRLKNELTSIKRRSKDLKQLISDNRSDLESTSSLLTDLYLEKRKAREIMDEDLSNSISPYLAERDAIVKELAQLDERREKAVHSLRVRNKQTALADQIGRLEGTIEKLKIKLDELKEDAPSLDNILKCLGTDINKFIQQVKIKNHHGVGIDEKTFFPKVRNIEYRRINSGGLRTIVSIGYLASILLQKLRKETNIPGLLMIDTVGKFLGKTPEDSEDSQIDSENDVDGVADPEKYRNLFNALVAVAEEFDSKGKLCQIILVDNDMPRDVVYENKGFEIAHYRSNGINGLPIGLIDDWDSVPKK
ncbi:ATP-binding protein [Aliidiomarina maris]|uniref:Exonuclease SbcC n=1 Tax=Aliidiomarina maris TaxID=531312 RepID=A0A327WQI6_9GAMM|nr:ATP-binding protein [Aliidiomarina maris]RAJ92926.1 hypothetical protein B0I24_12413 [Aliidiomarina maris]RUO22118.1 hypothetical protein CWE07_11050 [Aliidiomarina maris]